MRGGRKHSGQGTRETEKQREVDGRETENRVLSRTEEADPGPPGGLMMVDQGSDYITLGFTRNTSNP